MRHWLSADSDSPRSSVRQSSGIAACASLLLLAGSMQLAAVHEGLVFEDAHGAHQRGTLCFLALR